MSCWNFVYPSGEGFGWQGQKGREWGGVELLFAEAAADAVGEICHAAECWVCFPEGRCPFPRAVLWAAIGRAVGAGGMNETAGFEVWGAKDRKDTSSLKLRRVRRWA